MLFAFISPIKLDTSALLKVLLFWRNLSQLFCNNLLNLENFSLQWLLLALATLIWLLSFLDSLECHLYIFHGLRMPHDPVKISDSHIENLAYYWSSLKSEVHSLSEMPYWIHSTSNSQLPIPRPLINLRKTSSSLKLDQTIHQSTGENINSSQKP